MPDTALERSGLVTNRRGDDRSPRRVLLLTSGLGLGHCRAADAIAQALAALAPRTAVRELDFWSLMHPGVAESIQQLYLQIVQQHPDLYDRLYRLDEHTWRRIIESDMEPPPEVLELTSVTLANRNVERILGRYPSDLVLFPTICAAMPRGSRTGLLPGSLARSAALKAVWQRLRRRMLQQIRRFEPDVIVSTQMVPAALVAALRVERELTQPTIGVVTDFGVHDFWVQSGTDLYCVADGEMRQAPFEPEQYDRIDVTGVPLMPAFEHPPTAPEARTTLGLAATRPVILVLGGGLGIGVDRVAMRLLAGCPDVQIVVMTANNEDARSALADVAAQNRGRLSLRPWSESMAIYYAAASIVVGKPGGLTVAEALASGRPVLATRSLRGQEGFNVRYLERHGVGRLLDETQVIEQVRSWLADPAALEAVQQRAQRLGRRDGARMVAQHALAFAERYRGLGAESRYL